MFRSLVAVLCVAFTVVAVTVVVSERASAHSFAVIHAVYDHAAQANDALRVATRSIIDLEGAERTYLFTGDDKAIRSFKALRIALPKQLDDLRALLDGDPESIGEASDLQARVDHWMSEVADAEIEARRASPPGPAPHPVVALVQHLNGQALVDAARATSKSLRGRIESRRVATDAVVEAARVHVRHLIAATALGLGLLALVLGVRITRRLERKVLALANAADRIAAGDYALDSKLFADRSTYLVKVESALVQTARAVASRDLEARTLLAVARAIGDVRSLDDLAARLHETIQPVVPAARLGLTGLDAPRIKNLALVPAGSAQLAGTGWYEPPSRSVYRAVIERRVPIVVNDTSLREYDEDDRMTEFGISAYAVLPVLSGERVFAAIGLGLQHGGFSSNQVRFVETLGPQIARQIEGADLRVALEHRNEDLERATRAKSEFLAMMSHELRTPLNSIIGFSEVLADARVGALNDQQTRFINNVVDSGHHLLGLINDLLDLSKIEAGRFDVVREPCAPRGVVVDAVTSLRPLADVRRVTVMIEEANPATVLADPVRYKQVLYNFLSNAIKFTPIDGRIDIVFSREGEMVRVSVRDTGPGISSVELARLFEPFSQLERDRATLGGTGLGLALASQLTGLMGGRVGVQSEVGKGSTFWVDLPIAEGAPVVASSQTLSTKAASLALIVDDDPGARELLELTLQGVGYRTLSVATGEEALVVARLHRPSLITLDVFLPGIDGWDLLRVLGADPELSTIPVIMCTIEGDRRKAFSLGAHEHLTKPIDRDALLQAVGRRA